MVQSLHLPIPAPEKHNNFTHAAKSLKISSAESYLLCQILWALGGGCSGIYDASGKAKFSSSFRVMTCFAQKGFPLKVKLPETKLKHKSFSGGVDRGEVPSLGPVTAPCPTRPPYASFSRRKEKVAGW